MLYRNSAPDNRRLFCSAPLAHCAVVGCLHFSVLKGISIFYLGHRGWGRFPSSKMTTVSRTCRCRKWTHIASLSSLVLGIPPPGSSTGLLSTGRLCNTSAALPCGWGFPDPSLLFRSRMLCHPVLRQKSRLHLLPALPALELSLLLLPVVKSLSRHPSPVRRLWLVPRHLAWAANHAVCLPNISP